MPCAPGSCEVLLTKLGNLTHAAPHPLPAPLAHAQSAKGRIVLFRPDKNAERFAAGAERLSMPKVPEQQFVDAVQSLVSANRDWVSWVD